MDAPEGDTAPQLIAAVEADPAARDPADARARDPADARAREFGYDFDLKPWQTAVIDAVLAGQDTFVLMATGGGKSVCYTLPGLIGGFITLVVSPLISLMRDQCASLQKKGVTAVYLSSETAAERKLLFSGQTAVVFVTPERCLTFLDQVHLIRDREVGLVAVDEAHCISEWGHNFRPEFRQLARVREVLPTCPIMCLTATATPRVQDDIAALMLRDPHCVRGSFDRPNLSIEVRTKHGCNALGKTTGAKRNRSCPSAAQYDVAQMFAILKAANMTSTGHCPLASAKAEPARQTTLDVFLKGRKPKQEADSQTIDSNPGVCIVYCNTQKDTEEVSKLMNECHDLWMTQAGGWTEAENELPFACCYHAGLPAKTRSKVQDAFMAKQVRLLVATTAFGMGIDLPCIRFVFMWGAPKSLETFFQQIGRAGRDGLPSRCILWWAAQDFQIQDFLLRNSSEGEVLELNRALLARMRDFVCESGCRRASLLRYFGESVKKKYCGNCDNCCT